MNQESTTTLQQPAFLRFMANLVSYVFHPLFMSLAMTLLLYKLSPQSFAGFNVVHFGKPPLPLVASIFVSTVFFPLLSVLLMKALGFVESITLDGPKDRIIPLIATMTFYFWIYNVMSNTNAPFLLKVLLLGSFWGVIAIFMINIFFKISMHTTAAGGAVGMMLVLLLYSPANMVLPFFITLLFAGIIGTARLILSAHSKQEVWLGYIIGFLVQMTAYWYLQ
jgi:hypothetical protein